MASREIEKRRQEFPVPLSRMTKEKQELVQPSPKKLKFEQLRADRELFLRAFEKLHESSDFFEHEMQYNWCFFIAH